MAEVECFQNGYVTTKCSGIVGYWEYKYEDRFVLSSVRLCRNCAELAGYHVNRGATFGFTK